MKHIFILALSVFAQQALAAELPSAVRETFYLDYSWESPVPAGTVVDAANLDKVRDLMEPALADLVTAGDISFRVAAPLSFQPDDAYIEATARQFGTVHLDETSGNVVGHHAGKPFPQSLSPSDPQAGVKLAWNIRYSYGSDSGTVDPMTWRYIDMRSGKVERTIVMEAASLNFQTRLFDPAGAEISPNPSGIFRALYLLVREPRDIANTQLLVHRLADDTARERTWMYMSTQRRVRLLGSGQTTDAFLGSDIMIEDFLGYNGRITDMTWRYLGRQNILMPFFVRSDPASTTTFGGAGDCFPDVSWQLRPTDILEATPKDKSHPVSKRVFYVDAQTATITMGEIYDRGGKLWKLGMAAFAHPDHDLAENAGTHVPIFAALTMVDVQARHCTTITPKSYVGGKLTPSLFTVNSLRARGR